MLNEIPYLKEVIVFVSGGGLLWVFKTLLDYRKQNKDEFTILRETWSEQFKQDAIKIAELTGRLQSKEDECEQYKVHLGNLGTQMMSLMEDLERLELVDNDIPVPKWLKNKDLIMLSLNDAYERVFLIPNGFVRKDYIGKSDVDVWGDAIGLEYQAGDREAMDKRELIKTTETVKLGAIELLMWILKWPVFKGSEIVGVKGMAILIPKSNDRESKTIN